MDSNNLVVKPWGSEEILYKNNEKVIKKIFIKAGEQLSLQYHKDKEEVWIFDNFETKHIPKLSVHTNNLSDKDQTILEISTPELDDVVRVADRYNRGKNVLVCDMDNTLCESCQPIDNEMADMINKLSEHYLFTVIGGSTYEHIQEQVTSQLKCPTIYVLSNSGTIFDVIHTVAREKVYDGSLAKEEKREIISVLENLVEKYSIKTLTTKEDQIQDRGSQITLSAIGRHAPSDLKEKYDANKSKRIEWVTYLKPKLSKYEIKIGGTTSIDITKKGMNKGTGIQKFAKNRNIDLKDILFIGDGLFGGGNDASVIGIVDYLPVSSPEDTKNLFRQIIAYIDTT